MSRTALRICPLCEATCGLVLTVEDGKVTGARGDRDDVFSKGFVCPKGAAFPEVDSDPDRLRTPLVRVDGELREATWEEAFDAVAAGLRGVVERYGPHAVGVVLGNPNVHTMAAPLYPPLLIGGLGTHSLFTASTVDQMPKHVSSGLLFGDANLIPVPDLDRTGHLLLIGANPLESNGSLCTAPDFPGRLKALKARGGTLTVVDPRRTRTARLADRHLAVRPGTDALLLAAIARTLFDEDLVDLGDAAPHIQGVAELSDALADFTPRRSPTPATSTPPSSAPSPAKSPPRPPPPSTPASAAAPSRTAPSPAGSSTSSTPSPATWTGRAARSSRWPPPTGRRAPRDPAAASPSAAGTPGSAATPRPRANCRCPPSPRRSTPPPRRAPRSAPSSPSAPTRCSPRPTATGWTGRSPPSTSW